MTEIRIETTIENDGELHLHQLPFRRGDKVSAVVSLPSVEEESRREVARNLYIKLAHTSGFSSEGPFPSRDQLHVRD